jgi:hypothetical protein
MQSPATPPREAWSRRDRLVFIALLATAALSLVPLGLQVANGRPVLEGPAWMLGTAAAGLAMAIGFAVGKWLKDKRFPPLLVLAVVVLVNLPSLMRGLQDVVRRWPPSPTEGIIMLTAAVISGVVAYLVSKRFVKRRPSRD